MGSATDEADEQLWVHGPANADKSSGTRWPVFPAERHGFGREVAEEEGKGGLEAVVERNFGGAM